MVALEEFISSKIMHLNISFAFSVGSENPTKRAMYEETNRIGEKWSKIVFVFWTLINPICFVFPRAIFVYFTYFTTDSHSNSANDVFELPFFMW